MRIINIRCFVLMMITAIVLTGCSGGGVTTPSLSTEEAKVKSVIQEYFLALNDRNWNKAKNYCVYGSDRYYATIGYQQFIDSLASQYGTFTVIYQANVSNVSVNGNYAQAYINLNVIVSYAGYSDSESESGYYYLQKINNNWKIYAP